MSGTSSPRRRRLATIAASVSIGLAGVAWAGCGESDEEQALDQAQEQIDEAVGQLDEESQQAIEQAEDAAQEAGEQLEDGTGESP